ncbi:FkbM family methyltransferase [Novacetimonas pomaceti]|uniref:FkbM family methyltransferase n=3 Tax=Novacetimonas pomaceti TaxID=2021998 RepID=A0ABX5P7L0_9PROT|nr:FkbM family methyltransferase [Novacetimonas pomaceti]
MMVSFETLGWNSEKIIPIKSKIIQNIKKRTPALNQGVLHPRCMRKLPRAIYKQLIRANARGVPMDDAILCRVLCKYKMFVNPEDRGLSPHLILDGYWELSVTETMIDLVREGMTAIDVGANLGYFSVLLADLVGPDGHVIVAEPNPRMASLLTQSVRVNAFDSRVELVTDAITAESGQEMTLTIPRNFPQNGAVHYGAPHSGEDDSSTSVRIRTRTLDDIVGDRPVDFIKIDVEGSEQAVWAGMQGILGRGKPLSIILEFTPDRYADPMAFLNNFLQAGFGLSQITASGRQSVTPDDIMKGPLNIDRMLVLSR